MPQFSIPNSYPKTRSPSLLFQDPRLYNGLFPLLIDVEDRDRHRFSIFRNDTPGAKDGFSVAGVVPFTSPGVDFAYHGARAWIGHFAVDSDRKRIRFAVVVAGIVLDRLGFIFSSNCFTDEPLLLTDDLIVNDFTL